jgi:hypothetical protein
MDCVTAAGEKNPDTFTGVSSVSVVRLLSGFGTLS